MNKSDLKAEVTEKNSEFKDLNCPILKMSIKSGEKIESLYSELIKLFNLNQITMDNELLITNIRHQELIKKAIESTRMALNDFKTDMPIDIISINIKQILEHLGEITGDNVSDDIIKSIFAKFCLGK